MEAIAEGAADYAVLPIENSTAGIVADNFDLLVDFENYIVGEQVIKCEHVLMGLPGTELSDIRAVISHPQALSQCEGFLDRHRNWRRIPYDNTAMAARKVADEGDRTQAAIGSAFAAKRFGLEILADQIYDNEANSTRFIIVTNQRIFKRDAGKISICFEVPHRSGSLYNILSHFIYNNLNMNRIESRPITGRNWEYRFFIDFDGNLNQGSVKNALRGIREEAVNMKILGELLIPAAKGAPEDEKKENEDTRMKRIEELILYRLENHSLPERLSLLAGELNEREAESRDVDIYSGCMQELVETAGEPRLFRKSLALLSDLSAGLP